MPAQWSYVGVDLRSGAVLADLPLVGVRMSRTLSGYGALSGTLPLHGLPRPSDVVDAVDCGRRAIYALADGVPVWGGPSWSDPDDGADTLTVTAAEWGSYFARVKLRANLTYTQQDQLVIARGLVNAAQTATITGVAGTPGNVRVALGTETSGVLRDRTYHAGDTPIINELLDALANVSGGFDFAWPAEYDPSGVLRGRLALGYPRLGVSTATYVVDVPGRARQMPFARSAETLATTATALGQTVNGVVTVAESTDTSMLAAGYPVLDVVQQYQDVASTTTLQSHADADQKAVGGALLSITATVPIDDYLTGAVNLGDPVRVERFLIRDGVTGFVDSTLRVTQVDLDPEAQTCDLTLSPRVTTGGRVPRREDDRARLNRLHREVRKLTVTP